MKKLKFLANLKDNNGDLIFEKDKIYDVTNELDDCYYLGFVNGIKVGIDKKSENKKYIVINKGDK